MCAGATDFNVLNTYGVKSTDCVGITGMGGLGHLAIQYAAKMGCNVVVFSSSDDKRGEVMQLGATEFITTGGKSGMSVRRLVDALLVTTAVLPEWTTLLPALNTMKIFPLAVSPDDFRVSKMQLNAKGITVQGSIIAPRSVQRNMLMFSAQHKIKLITMLFPMTQSGIEDAMSKLRNGEMRYCGVLKPR
jgi:D-arabinose 1-dehydrogenase-like Zn-dependent alcohol dehydrogenase